VLQLALISLLLDAIPTVPIALIAVLPPLIWRSSSRDRRCCVWTMKPHWDSASISAAM